MKKNIIILVSLIIVGMCFCSCKKQSELIPIPKTESNIKDRYKIPTPQPLTEEEVNAVNAMQDEYAEYLSTIKK